MRFPISNKDNNNIARLHSLKIGIIGGTGGMGKGFAIRWCINHDILVGSRDAERASKSAEEYTNTAKEAYGKINGSISGNDNVSIAKESDVLVLSIPYENIDSTCSQILPQIKDSCVVISPIVPMTKTELGFEFIPIKENKPFSYQLVVKHMKKKSKDCVRFIWDLVRFLILLKLQRHCCLTQ